MSEAALPPRHILDKLICFACQEYLSCDPVRILPNNSVICGRCRKVQMQNVNTIRSLAFEKLAAYFLFPCKHPKCNAMLERSQLLSHELKCDFQPGCSLCFRACCQSSEEVIKYSMEYKQADDSTMEYLICSYCHGYLISSPIFLRPDGQNICYRCGPDFQTPPILRNYPLESMLEMFILKCSYRMRGCDQRMLFGLEMIKHETTCAYNPLNNASEEEVEVAAEQSKQRGVIPTISGHIYATVAPKHFQFKNNHGGGGALHGEEIEMEEFNVRPRRSTSRAKSPVPVFNTDSNANANANSRAVDADENDGEVFVANKGLERNPSFLAYNNVVKELGNKLKRKSNREN